MSGTEVLNEMPVDGRRARRERSRLAVIDAMFSLVQDGKIPPAVEDVAERAGVSVSSVFRNFDGLDDLQRHAVDRFRDRYEHLFTAEPAPGSGTTERIEHFVNTRIELYEQAGSLMSLGRQRALDYQPMAEAMARHRVAFARQVHRCFDAELRGRTPADAADLVAMIDSLTSPEAFDVMSKSHARSRRRVASAWTIGLNALLDCWPTAVSTAAPRIASNGADTSTGTATITASPTTPTTTAAHPSENTP